MKSYKQLKGLEDYVDFSGNNSPFTGALKFKKKGHDYNKEILGPDVGCGMTAFIVKKNQDYKNIADKIAQYIKNKGVLGRGNHFIDVCSALESKEKNAWPEHYVIIIHSDGKKINTLVPETIEQAKEKARQSQKFRKDLGLDIAHELKTNFELIGDWPHNTVETGEDSVLYRKGAVKTAPEKLHILPANLNETIPFYSFHKNKLPKLKTMPHGSGRKAPLSELKADLSQIKDLRERVYVPYLISDASLRSEHPICYKHVWDATGKMDVKPVIIDEVKILAYIGKI